MAKKKETPASTIVAYKGFDENMQCRGYQYEVGKEYLHEGSVEACANGFHACEYPLHVLRYYKPGTSRFAIVEQGGELSRHGDDTKVASSKITVKAEINLAGLIRRRLSTRPAEQNPPLEVRPRRKMARLLTRATTVQRPPRATPVQRPPRATTGKYVARKGVHFSWPSEI